MKSFNLLTAIIGLLIVSFLSSCGLDFDQDIISQKSGNIFQQEAVVAVMTVNGKTVTAPLKLTRDTTNKKVAFSASLPKGGAMSFSAVVDSAEQKATGRFTIKLDSAATAVTPPATIYLVSTRYAYLVADNSSGSLEHSMTSRDSTSFTSEIRVEFTLPGQEYKGEQELKLRGGFSTRDTISTWVDSLLKVAAPAGKTVKVNRYHHTTYGDVVEIAFQKAGSDQLNTQHLMRFRIGTDQVQFFEGEKRLQKSTGTLSSKGLLITGAQPSPEFQKLLTPFGINFPATPKPKDPPPGDEQKPGEH